MKFCKTRYGATIASIPAAAARFPADAAGDPVQAGAGEEGHDGHLVHGSPHELLVVLEAVGLAEDLLGGHVLRRSEDRALLRRLTDFAVSPLRDPEIHDLDEVGSVRSPRDEEVRRLEVTVDDRVCMRLGHPLADLEHVVQRHGQGERSAVSGREKRRLNGTDSLFSQLPFRKINRLG